MANKNDVSLKFQNQHKSMINLDWSAKDCKCITQ